MKKKNKAKVIGNKPLSDGTIQDNGNITSNGDLIFSDGVRLTNTP